MKILFYSDGGEGSVTGVGTLETFYSVAQQLP